jgi:hypothetical protein
MVSLLRNNVPALQAPVPIAAPFRAGAPAGEHVGMRHRPGLRDGVRTSAKVRPAVVAP